MTNIKIYLRNNDSGVIFYSNISLKLTIKL